MSEILRQITDLSPEKRKLLELLLKEQGVDLSRSVIVPQSRDTNVFPLSFAQQRLWFLDQLEPGSPMYNIPSAVRLTGQLDLTALERSINEILKRHEVLRTTFVAKNGRPVQVIAPQGTFTLPVKDLRDLPEGERETEALRLASEEARRPFDLTSGPLLRVTLLRLDEREYVALLTMHHIISDGWSMGVLIGEMAALYEAFSAGRPSPLPGLPIQYADFAHWQRGWLQGEVLEGQLSYWKNQLDGDLGVLDLPTDHPRPAFQTMRGASLSFTFPRHLGEALKAVGQAEQATLFMTLLAAFQALLFRYSGQDHVNVGSPIANRNRGEIEGLIGFFVNTLVLRADLSGEPTFRELLRQVRQVTLDAYAHQDLPFEMLVEELQPERDMSRTPLFQAMFILQNAPLRTRQLPHLTIRPVEAHSGTSTFDLTLLMGESPQGLLGAFEYNTDLFDESTIKRMVGHFHTLLEGVIADPNQHISRLPLLSGAERQRLLVEWNDTTADYARDQCVHHLFEARAARTPDAVALVLPATPEEPSQHLTYRELNRRTNQLAYHLRKLGMGPETLVGLCLDRSLDMVVGLLGILKAGAAYLPLDPTYPQSRLTFMLRDSQAPVLLTQQHLLERLPSPLLPTPYSLLLLDADWANIAQEPAENLDSGVRPENLAYVIYTSGSTGTPKGVLVHHRAVVNHNTAVAKAFQLGPADRALQFATINFDAAVEELFPTWLSGATMVLRPQAVLAGATELQRLIEKEQLTVLNLPTAYWHEWVYELSQSGARLPDALRLVIVGGEKALSERLVAWQNVGGDALSWMNTYGPTETTIIATLYQVSGAAGRGDVEAELPIGRPIANAQVYVLDRRLQPQPVGVPGELYIGGAGVARGYLERPGLTAERFLPDPFSPPSFPLSGGDEGGDGARFYRTGDLARYQPDGNIEFLGRVDHQVKVRGFRVELGEVEAALGRHPVVREAVVVAREDGGGSERLMAYIVLEQEASFNVGELRTFLKGELPEYMVPSALVTLETLPLTPSGKVDRRALPVPDLARPELESVYVAPRTPVEELLAGTWAQLLGVEQVGVHDNFFELGGHSLLATQLISRLPETFQVELPLRALFERPTVAGLAQRIETARREVRGLSAPPIEAVPRDGDLPLSFAQQRLWFLDQLEPGSPLYNVPDAVRITGALDVAALEKSLNEIVRRHEVLRTVFPTLDGKAVQVIAPELALPLPLIDLGALPIQERRDEAQRLAMAEAQRPFDLARGPLLRVTLLRLGQAEKAGEWVVLLTMHHIVSDGWSGGVLVRELALLYQAFAADKPSRQAEREQSPLPELPIQYTDFAHWQRKWLQGEVLEAQRSYWKQQLQGLPPRLELPTNRPRPAIQSSRGAHQTFTLPRDLSRALKDLGQREGTTLFMTLLAAFEVLLYRYTGQENFGVGTPIANRNRAEIEGLIGFFVNTLVMRADLSGAPSFRELLEQVREVALGAYAHQDLPFEMLVDELQPQRDLSHTPLFQVMFILQNASAQVLEMPGLTLGQLEVDTGVAPFDLTLAMGEGPDGLGGAFEYNADLFDAATIQRIVRHFQSLLEGFVADPGRSVATSPFLAQAERQRLLVEWNGTGAGYPRDLCLQQLFEAQVTRTPDADAVVLPTLDSAQRSERLSFQELNRRANQLAHYVQKLGVAPETLVGLCVERSLDMMVGLLGILKAGAAYLPLDPAYPQERLAFMLQDSRVPVLLTQTQLLERLPLQQTNQQAVPSNGRTNQPTVICLDADWENVAQESDENLTSGVRPDNLAYVIYTSGSTGVPKGVLVSHRSVVNHNLALAEQFGLKPTDRVLQFATINFDAALEEIFPTWSRGATLVLRPGEILMSGEELLRLIGQQKLTVLDLPTAYWHAWVYELSLSGAALPASLRLVIVGGDKASSERFLSWRKLGGADVAWMNTYGPTEGTIIATLYAAPLGGEEWQVEAELPIGRPIANARVYVLDPWLEPQPVGVPGELHIGGAGVARGYLERPDLTAERFVPDPFSPPSSPPRGGKEGGGARLYKTGDLVRYRSDGNIEFVGRVDHQVKVRGFRVEPGEIEALLEQLPDVRQGVVLAQDVREPQSNDAGRGAGDKRLVAYVVPEDGVAPTPGELRNRLKEKLPDYMLPSAFVVLDALPLTPSGKVDRRALPAPGEARLELESAYVAPRTPQEQTLAGVWAEVLGVEKVGVHDNFFELGGDSILSIQVVARANQVGLRLTPRQLFEYPTVAGLAGVAGKGRAIQAEQGVVQGPLPLTPIQHWFFEQTLPEPHHWNQALLLTVRQALDPALLEEAAGHLTVHHDALRLRFTPGKSGWEQMNAGIDGRVPFACLDLSALPEQAQKAAIEARSAEVQASLDLTRGPLWRVVYFDLGVGRSGRLLIVVHHLAMDGVSWRVLLEDLQAAYVQIGRGESVQLPPKTTSFQHWARRLAEHAQTDALRQELPFWLSVFEKGFDRLPVDYAGGANTEAVRLSLRPELRPRGAHDEASARSVTVSLDAQETQALLQEVPAAYRTEINDVLLTALVQAIAGWSGVRTLVVELEGHGREDLFEEVDVSRTVGWFTTTYPVALSLADLRAGGPGAALRAVKEQLRQVPNRGIGYGLLRYLTQDAQVAQRLRALPQPQVSFNYLGQFDQALPQASPFGPAQESRGPDRSLEGRQSHRSTEAHERLLEINGGIARGQLGLEWTYSENVYRRTTIERLAQGYLKALRALIAHCQSPEAGGYTPTDFPLAKLDQKKLDKVLSRVAKPKGKR